MGGKLGRAAALTALAALALPLAAEAAAPTKLVRAYPGLRIPRVWTTVNEPSKSPGYVFTAPRAKLGQRTGPTIFDAEGRVVWFQRLPSSRTAIGLQPQTYRGQPVLTWGQRPPLEAEGDFYRGSRRTVYNVIADDRYRIIKRIRARGMMTDLHEFTITRRDTALVLGVRILRRNLRRYGGPRNGYVFDNVIQEIDIRSGRMLWSWSALRRLSPRNTYVGHPREGAWDPHHINAVTEDSDGNLLVTSRHMSAVYKLDRADRHVIWQLGGRSSDFRVSGGARFFYPHDARRAPDGTLTIFDNRATAFDRRGRGSRAIRLRLSSRRRTATAVGGARHPKGSTLATSQGGAHALPSGGLFVGWGSSPWFSEHAGDGRVLFAAHFHSAWNQSYRAFKGPWKGNPQGDPAVAAVRSGNRVAIYAAWNGATEVAAWRVLGGAGAGSLAVLGTALRTDFETRMAFSAAPAAVQVEALDAIGRVIGRSEVVAPKTS